MARNADDCNITNIQDFVGMLEWAGVAFGDETNLLIHKSL
jgi:hypothetical protein